MDVNISEIVKAVAEKIQAETGNGGISSSEVNEILKKIETPQPKKTEKTADEIANELTKKVLQDMKGGNVSSSGGYTYPLAKNHPDLLKSKTGKPFSEITFDNVIQGKVIHEDFKTNADTLLMQAEIAEKAGKKQFAGNMRRAAELTRVPDEEVLRIYDKLRPNRATKQELLDIANELRTKYQANITADLVEETAKVYEKRNILL
ncbi:MAG: diol dehydratase small subunit [Ruminococcaceae bacterium]|nr:diol dehydratase small subunit [Oscillospiraceae bacterium]